MAELKALVANPEDRVGQVVRPGPAMGLLDGYMASLASLKEPPSAELGTVIGVHLLDLVAAALGPTAEGQEIIAGRGLKAARLRVVLAEIARRFGNPDLDVDAIASGVGLSRRSVQRLLEETGKPFTEQVTERRLQRAYVMLSDPAFLHLRNHRDRARRRLWRRLPFQSLVPAAVWRHADGRPGGGGTRQTRLKGPNTYSKLCAQQPRSVLAGNFFRLGSIAARIRWIIEPLNVTLLTEGPAIVQFIADQVPSKRLAPNGTIERTKLQAWLNFFSSEMHKGAFGPLFYKGISEESKVVFRRRLRARFAHLDQHLADHEYLIGNEFTIADAHFFAVTNWAPRVDFDLSQYPKVLAHHARIAARPTVRAAMEAEGPIPGAGS